MSLHEATTHRERPCPRCGVPLREETDECPSCAETIAARARVDGAPAGFPKEIAHFEILRTLGSGGMGTVFEAFDRNMRRRVALKILSLHAAGAENVSARFEREAWIAGRLTHPGLVKVFERGSWADLSYYSMELMDGGSLHDVIKRMRQWGEDRVLGLSFGSREYIAWGIATIIAAARALDHVHREGIVHRDIKPMNILLSLNPQAVKLTDFGIALDKDASRLTAAGGLLGTVAYMPPEQIRGRVDLIDSRCDVYALGVTLFHLLTLELPYEGDSQELYVTAVLTSAARRASRLNARVGRDLDVVIGKTLEKDPQDRYETCAAFADDLESVLAYRPVRARPPTGMERTVKWVRRKPIHALLAAVLIATAPVLGTLGFRSWQGARLRERIEVEALWDQARRLSLMDRPGDALGPLGVILARDPDHLLARRATAWTEWRLAGQESEPARRDEHRARALAEATALVDRLEGVSWPYRLRAFFLADFGRGEEAARDEAEALRLRSEPPAEEEVEIEAIHALLSGDAAGAVRGFSDLISRRPGNEAARLHRAAAYRMLGDLSRARIDYEIAAGLTPRDPVPLYNLGRILTMEGALAEGEARYRQAIEREPLQGVLREGLSENLVKQGTAEAAAGGSDAALRRFKEAEAEAREAIRLDPDLVGARLNLGTSLAERSRLPGEASPGLLAGASEAYDDLLDRLRALPAGDWAGIRGKAYASQCDVLVQRGELRRALEVCRLAVETSPDEAVGYYNLAGVYALLGRRAEALDALEKDVALGDREHAYLEADPWFEGLRADPRFRDLLRRMREARAR